MFPKDKIFLQVYFWDITPSNFDKQKLCICGLSTVIVHLERTLLNRSHISEPKGLEKSCRISRRTKECRTVGNRRAQWAIAAPDFGRNGSNAYSINPISIGAGWNQPIYEYHVTTAGMKRVKRPLTPSCPPRFSDFPTALE